MTMILTMTMHCHGECEYKVLTSVCVKINIWLWNRTWSLSWS